MDKPVIYGISASRAFRSIWAIEEVGIDYEHVPTSFRGDAQAPEYLDINPNGRIPALVDGDLQLCESMAINLYLARKYGGRLMPADAEGEAQANQWSVWAISEIEPLQMQIVVQKFFTPEEQRDEGVVARAEKALVRPLDVLDARLAHQTYLLGESFSIADLNVAGVMDLLSMVEFNLDSWSNVQRWLAACRERPSYGKAKVVGVE